jgi:hypothetical protein
MLLAAFIVMATAGVAGICLLGCHLTRTPMPGRLASAHGLVAAAGAILLLLHASRGNLNGTLRTALIVLGFAACGGIFLFTQHLRLKPLSKLVMGVHAVLAATGLLILLVAVAGPIE